MSFKFQPVARQILQIQIAFASASAKFGFAGRAVPRRTRDSPRERFNKSFSGAAQQYPALTARQDHVPPRFETQRG